MSHGPGSFSRFATLLILTQFLSIVAVAGADRLREAALFAVVFVFALVWREFRFGHRHSFVDVLRRRSRLERKAYFVFGTETVDEKPEKDDERDYRELVGSSLYLQSGLFYLLLVGVVGYLAHRGAIQIPQGFWLVGLMGFPLVAASHSSHLLLSLFGSVVVVLFGIWWNATTPLIAALYVVSFFLAAIAFRQWVSEGAYGAKARITEAAAAIDALKAALSFGVLVWFFEFLMPQPRPDEPYRLDVKGTSPGVSRLAEGIVENMIRYQSNDSERKASERRRAESNALDSSADQSQRPTYGPENFLTAQTRAGDTQVPELLKETGDSPPSREELESLARSFRAGQGSPGNAMGSMKESAGEAHSQRLQSAKDLTPEQRMEQVRRLQEQLRAMREAPGGKRTAERVARGESGGGTDDLRVSQRMAKNQSASGRATAEPSSSDRILAEKNSNDPELIEEQRKKIEALLSKAQKILEIALVIGVLVFGWKFLVRASRVPDPETAMKVRLTREQKIALRQALAKLRAKNLPPDQEVIETYHALMNVFEAMRFPRSEDLPAGQFAKLVRMQMPHISAPMHQATDCFERTLYGSDLFSPDHLSGFRGSVRAILKYFNV